MADSSPAPGDRDVAEHAHGEGSVGMTPGKAHSHPAGSHRHKDQSWPSDPLTLDMEGVARHDVAALQRVYERTADRIRAMTYHFLRDHAEAEEVVQDVFLTVWTKAARYDAGRAHPMAWLTVITRNRCIDRLRQRARRHALAEDLSWIVDTRDHGADDRLLVIEGEQRLRECLEQLEDNTRAAIDEAFFSGMTYEALAKAKGEPLGTVKSRIRRGLMSLRRCLEA